MLYASSLLEQIPNNLPRVFLKGEFGQMIGLGVQLSKDMVERNRMEVVDDVSSLVGPMPKFQIVQGVLVLYPIYNCFRISKKHGRKQVHFLGKVEKAPESHKLNLSIRTTTNSQLQSV